MLNDKKMKAIEYLIKGENVSDTAKLVGVSRQALYNWMDDSDFKAEFDKQIQEIRTQGQQRLNSKLTTYIQEIEKIALTGKSEKNKLDGLQYLINRILGTPTNKIADVSEEEKKEDDFSLDALEELGDNVIELDIKAQ